MRYGITARGCPAEPYRTVAVDPKIIKLGSQIYVPELKGTVLPDGSKHDGIFIANDRGRFRGAHIDVFVGLGPESTRPFRRKGYPSRSRVTVHVEGKTARRCR
jgi:3D (Asp-Asp-Asp) domain-containing protein